MPKTFVISGGNSGIGLEVGRQLGRAGHAVVLLGRDPAKGAAAAEAVRAAGGTATFHAVDLSTHAGVRAAAEAVAAAHPKLDGLVLGAGVLTMKDVRTADGLHAVFATNYLSRYHLTQLLLPQLRAAGKSTVVLIVAGVPLDTKINFTQYPRFDPFPGMSALSSIQVSNHHYVAHLAKTEPSIRAAAVNVGLVRTDIMRDMPAPMRFALNVMPFITVTVEKAAANPAWLSTSDAWATGHYWHKPGRSDFSQQLRLDAAQTERVIATSRELTGA